MGPYHMKAALSMSFCYNHARRWCRNIKIAWLDLQNAIGLVPTKHLLSSLEDLRLTGSKINVVANIYQNLTTYRYGVLRGDFM